jgi:hydrogenase expression/formation protein HypC
MCLAVPGKIIEMEQGAPSRFAKVDFGGVTRRACLDFVPEANVGDYVIVHVGFALSRVEEQEALRTLEILQRMGELAGDDPPSPLEREDQP